MRQWDHSWAGRRIGVNTLSDVVRQEQSADGLDCLLTHCRTAPHHLLLSNLGRAVDNAEAIKRQDFVVTACRVRETQLSNRGRYGRWRQSDQTSNVRTRCGSKASSQDKRGGRAARWSAT